jgi:hypothetical protein
MIGLSQLLRRAPRRIAKRYSTAVFGGPGEPSAGLGTNGQTYTRTDAPYDGWVYLKSGGVWAVHTIPDASIFTMGAQYTSYRNPATYSAASGEIPFGYYLAGSLNYNNIGSPANDLTAIGVGGVVRGDSSVVYGPVTDPSGNGQAGWMELSCKSIDADDSGAGVKRAEENYDIPAGRFDQSDEFWHAFAWRDYSNGQNGFGTFGYRSGSDYDGVDVQFCHDRGFSGGMPSFVSLLYTVTNTGTPVRTFRISTGTWGGSQYNTSSVYQWAGGTSVTLANGQAATVDPNYPANIGERWQFVAHVKYGTSGYYTKVWGAAFGSSPALLVNNTTNAPGFDPTASGGSNTAAYYCKGRGIYQTSFPAGSWYFRAAKRRDVALRNKHQVLLNAGHTEASIVSAFSTFLQAT